MHTPFKLLIFVILFTVGASAIGISALCDDILLYYRNQQNLAKIENKIDSLLSLNKVYDSLLTRIKNNTDIIHSIAPAVLGIKPKDPNTIYPIAAMPEIKAAEQILKKHTKNKTQIPDMPNWLIRISQHKRKTGLFAAGGILVLISLIYFGLTKINNTDITSS